MKALSLKQPWASLVAIGAKGIETRDWATPYRGPIAIHASKKFDVADQYLLRESAFARALGAAGLRAPSDLPCGAIVATAVLSECVRFPMSEKVWRLAARGADEIYFGDFTTGRYGFVLVGVRALPTPIPCRGALGLWDVPAELLDQLRAARAA